MADDLRSILAEAAMAAETSAEPVERRVPTEPVQVAETEKPATGERARGPDGKFIASTDPETEPETAEEPEDDIEASKEPEETTAAAPALEVPAHWSQSDKDLIAQLPAEHRRAVVDRYKAIEAGYAPKLQRAAELEKQYGGVSDIFAPATEIMKQRGIVPADVIRSWHGVERALIEGAADAQQGRANQKGAQIVANLIRNYLIDPGAVAAILQGQIVAAPDATKGTQSADHQGGQLPPAVAARLEALEQRENQRLQQEEQSRLSEVQSKIDAFMAEKDGAGNLLRPFFSELEQDIMALARIDRSQGKTPDLADLYDRASYANREVREKLLSAHAEEAKRKAAADRRAKAAAAQRTAVSVAGSPGTGQSPAEPRGRASSLRQALEESFADQDSA